VERSVKGRVKVVWGGVLGEDEGMEDFEGRMWIEREIGWVGRS
jgi:hypothetical protein